MTTRFGADLPIFADVLDRTIRQVKDPIQANVRGAGLIAAVALGHLTFDDISERIQIAYTYQPNPQHRRVYDELFKEFANIYQRNKKIGSVHGATSTHLSVQQRIGHF